MRYKRLKITIGIVSVLSALTFSNLLSPAFAQEQVNSGIEMSGEDAEYKQLTLSFNQKLTKLEQLGGGIKPFSDRFNAIDASYDGSKSINELQELTLLVDKQLETLTTLRTNKTKKPVAARAVVARDNRDRSTGFTQMLNDSSVRSTIMNFVDGNTNKKSYSDFNGSANDYVLSVAKDVITKELGGIEPPVKGPFILDRFRNVQRICELKRNGGKVDALLNYHRATEEIAVIASRDPGRVAELSQRVLYLRQQLGLSPLQSSSLSVSSL